MLFDPKWETKADPLSLSSLIGWLELQPKDDHYYGMNPHECVIAQWLKSMDHNCRPVLSDDPLKTFEYRFHGRTVDLQAFQPIAFGGGPTFGAALDRARKQAAG